MKKLRVTIEGKAYDVLVEILDEGTATPARAPAPAFNGSTPLPAAPSVAAAPASDGAANGSAPSAAGPGDVLSPLAGKLVSIDVTAGSDVAEGTRVATVEAMKMNTYIFAPKSGRVDRILVQAGDGVEEGSILLHLS